MTDPIAEIKTLLTQHMRATEDRNSRDDQFRGEVKGALQTITNEQNAFRASLNRLEKEHEETRRMASAARDSSAELEGRALVAIAELTATQSTQGMTIAEIKVETKAQTETLDEIATELRVQKELREERERVAAAAIAAAKVAEEGRRADEADALEKKKEKIERIKRPLSLVLLILAVLGAVNAAGLYLLNRVRGEKPPPPVVQPTE